MDDRRHGISDSKKADGEKVIVKYEHGLREGVGLRFKTESLIADEYEDKVFVERYKTGKLIKSVQVKI